MWLIIKLVQGMAVGGQVFFIFPGSICDIYLPGLEKRAPEPSPGFAIATSQDQVFKVKNRKSVVRL